MQNQKGISEKGLLKRQLVVNRELKRDNHEQRITNHDPT